MTHSWKLLAAAMTSLVFAGCQMASGITESRSGAEASTQPSIADEFGPYSGPKARLALADFQWKVGGEGGGTVTISGMPGTGAGGVTISAEKRKNMRGLEDMLTTALVQSNRYRVLERSQLQEVQAEQKLGASGQVDEATAVKAGAIAGADILVVAAITGWEPNSGGGSVGGGGGGLLGKASAMFGGISGSMKKSSMAMDIRLIDAETTEILAATSVTAEAQDVNFGGALAAIGGSGAMGGGLSSYSNTPMEKVIRKCILEATKYVTEHTPERFFQDA